MAKYLSFLAIGVALVSGSEQQPNPPKWPESVKVFTESMNSSSIDSVIAEVVSRRRERKAFEIIFTRLLIL